MKAVRQRLDRTAAEMGAQHLRHQSQGEEDGSRHADPGNSGAGGSCGVRVDAEAEFDSSNPSPEPAPRVPVACNPTSDMTLKSALGL